MLEQPLIYLRVAQRTRIFVLEPFLDALLVEDVFGVAWESGHVVIRLEVLETDNAVFRRFFPVTVDEASELLDGQPRNHVVVGGLPVGLLHAPAQVAQQRNAHDQDAGVHAALAHGEVAEPQHRSDRVRQRGVFLRGRVVLRRRINYRVAGAILLEEYNVTIDIPSGVRQQNDVPDQHVKV